MESAVPSLVAMDSSMAGFAKDLELLDTTNNRTIDTAHVFYVRAGQSAPHDILSNVVSIMLQFMNFVFCIPLERISP